MASYAELLTSEEWKEKRSKILKRDNFTCVECRNANLFANVKKGFVEKSHIIPNLLVINKFDNIPKEGTLVKKDIYKVISNYNIFVYYENNNNNDFLNLLAIRKLIERERFEYIQQPYNIFIEEVKSLKSRIIDTEKMLQIEKKVKEYKIVEIQDFTEDEIKHFEWLLVKGLHVHHTYYKINTQPWDYPDESLKTYCWICHENLHKTVKIPVLDENNKEINRYTPCSRCCGAGVFPEYRHIQAGICFRCDGARYEELIK